MYVWYAPAINSGEPRLQTARKTDRGTIFILRPYATACNLALEGGTNIGVIAQGCDDSDPCAENELNDSKLDKLTHRGGCDDSGMCDYSGLCDDSHNYGSSELPELVYRQRAIYMSFQMFTRCDLLLDISFTQVCLL